MSSSRSRKARNGGREDWLWRNVRDRRPIGTIDHATLQPHNSLVSSATPCELLCTYDWKDKDEPTIQIPGHAPRWRSKPLPVTLPQDRGRCFVDQNAARLPESTFEPLFRAAAFVNPSFRFDEVDVVLNRNSLRKLLDFCKGTTLESFRVNLFIINNTLFIERCSQTNTQVVRRPAGYGRSFEREFTKPAKGETKSTGHHRVLQYCLGNLKCVVRFEVDACYEGSESKDESEGVGGHPPKLDEPLAAAIQELNLEDSESNNVTPSSSKITMKTASLTSFGSENEVMPQSIAAELKTTAGRKSLGSILPQLWFGRTPWLILGYHTKGTFGKVKISRLKPDDFIDWEISNQDALRKIVTVITQLRVIVKENQGRFCIAVFEHLKSGPRAIKVYASSKVNKRPLPEDLVKKFWHS